MLSAQSIQENGHMDDIESIPNRDISQQPAPKSEPPKPIIEQIAEMLIADNSMLQTFEQEELAEIKSFLIGPNRKITQLTKIIDGGAKK